MRLSVLVFDEAEKDIDEAFIWYEEQKAGLGEEFILYLSKSFQFIARHPEASANVRKHVHRYIMNKFPFGVYYTVDYDIQRIYIIAVLHFKRKPSIWRKR